MGDQETWYVRDGTGNTVEVCKVVVPNSAYQKRCRFGEYYDQPTPMSYLNWALKQMGYGEEYYFKPDMSACGREWLVNKCNQYIAEYEDI